MEPTRRGVVAATLVAVLLVGAVLFARPVALVGASALGAWLLTAQYRFLRTVERVDEEVTVETTVTPRRVATDDPATVRLTVTADRPIPTTVTVAADPPVGTRSEGDRVVTLTPGDGPTERAEAAFTVASEVAGRYSLARTILDVRGPRGLFAETLPREDGPTLTVEPRTPRDLHVGTGGEEVAIAFGDHDAGRIGTGLEPAEIREYTAGDAARRIDWKATARLNEPHVREFEAETDRTTALLVDARTRMGTGPDGATPLAYAREVALVFLAAARRADDPVGLYAVGDEGLTVARDPTASADHYATLRSDLEGLRATPDDGPGPGRESRAGSPAWARRAAAALDDGTGAGGTGSGTTGSFAHTLRPFFAATDPYVQRLTGDPLFGAARARITRLTGTVRTVLLTDDSDPVRVRETVKLARRGDDHVVVFLTPQVLFEPGSLGDLEAAYERYRAFESFRRDLARLDRVSAFEVGPGDRVGSILDARRARRAATTGEARP
jgi:uncharacterized protein (DUF58 family)